ncbi:MAG TPA: DUF423 domain-containing protein [Steroidobacteraceae bacterium]|nr:DUF423 domain-containing protein [Steroidobacteraceae bacterium]
MKAFAHSMLAIGGLLLALAAALGAIEVHVLAPHLSAAELATFDTALRYQFFNAPGLLAIGLFARSAGGSLIRISGWLVALGVVLFSGSLYLHVVGAPRLIGVLTPVGGVALISGWVIFALGAWRSKGG